MKTYIITFVTLDGNTNQVYVDSYSKGMAILKFQNEYQYSIIKSCQEL